MAVECGADCVATQQALEVPGASVTGMSSQLPFNKIFGEDNMVLPMFLDRKHFEKDVEYVPDFMEQKSRAIQVQVTSEGELSAQIGNVFAFDSSLLMGDPMGLAKAHPIGGGEEEKISVMVACLEKVNTVIADEINHTMFLSEAS